MKTICLFLNVLIIALPSRAQDAWIKKSNYGGGKAWNGVGFSIGDAGFIQVGSDFWEYDAASDTWTQDADFPGGHRYNAVGFCIGHNGYIGTGVQDSIPYYYTNDFWEYDSEHNIWIRKKDFGGIGREAAVGFSIGNKGYIGTGRNSVNHNLFSDFWEYDADKDTWALKSPFAGGLREDAVGFSIGDKGYVGTGSNGDDYGSGNRDFWEYDPKTDTWTAKAKVGGTGRWSAFGMAIGTKGFIGGGIRGVKHFYDFWEYDPARDEWTQRNNFSGSVSDNAVAFSISGKGYVGEGFIGNFWEYEPEITGIDSLQTTQGPGIISIFHNPFEHELYITCSALGQKIATVLTLNGHEILKQKLISHQTINVSSLAKGIYLVSIIDDKGNILRTEKILISGQ